MFKSLVRTLIIIFIFLIIPLKIIPAEYKISDIEQLIIEANDFYKKGKFTDAANIYEQIEKQGYVNGHLFYNLGNAYYREGKTGKAILYFKKARKLLPRDEDLQGNLDHVRQQIKDQVEEERSSPLSVLFFWVYLFNFQELTIFFLIMNGLFFLLLTIRLFKNNQVIKRITVFFLIIYLFAIGSVFSRYKLEASQDQGVVMAEEINVRSGNSSDATILFKLHEGTDFKIEEEKNDWMKIVLSDGKKGWVEKVFVGVY